jgi:hypothetical protein
MAKTKTSFDHQRHHAERLAGLNGSMPYVLRITEWKDKPIPVLIVKKRHYQDESERTGEGERRRARSILIDRGNIFGESLQRCLPVLRRILEGVTDKAGVPLELHRYMSAEGLRLRGNLPLDEEAGAKLALIFRLQDRLKDLDRVELIAHRVARFTREEAAYWLSRTTSFGTGPNRWALSGLKIMLGGHANDPEVQKLLEHYRISA